MTTTSSSSCHCVGDDPVVENPLAQKTATPTLRWTRTAAAVGCCCLVVCLLLLTAALSTSQQASSLLSSFTSITNRPLRGLIRLEDLHLRHLQEASMATTATTATYSTKTQAHHTSTSSQHHHTGSHNHHNNIPYDQCPNLLPSLDHLVHQIHSRIRVYVTYHNEVGQSVLENITCHHTRKWIIPVLCNATKYFEYYSFKQFHEMTLDDFRDVDYVLIAGYKTFAPSDWNLIGGMPFSTQDGFLQALFQYATKHREYDIFPLFRDSGPVVKTLPQYHGHNALDALIKTLRAVNWTEAEIQDSIWAHAFYRNSFLAKPAAFLEIARLMSTMIDTAEHDPVVAAAYSQNASYPFAVPETAMKVFGVPYYMLHCFVMERMVAVVVDHAKLALCETSFRDIMLEMHGPWPPHEPAVLASTVPPQYLVPLVKPTASSSSSSQPRANSTAAAQAAATNQSHHPAHNHHAPSHHPHNSVLYHKCPNLLPSLDHLVHQNHSRVKLYVTYHNDVGLNVLQNITCHHTRRWIEPVLCNATKYFEYYAYKLFNQMTLSDFKDVDYVLLSGYKTLAPNNWNLDIGIAFYTTDLHMQGAIQFAINHPEYDVIPFYYDHNGPILKMFPVNHGHDAIAALIENLRAVHWAEADVQDSIWAHGVYRNTLLIKPAAFLELARWMTMLIEAVESNPTLAAFFDKDAGYPGDKDTAMKVFGAPYYQLHCFVMERLIAVVLDHMKVKVYDKTFDHVMNEIYFSH